MKIARISTENWFKDEQYVCKCDWPEDCFVQGGSDGMVIKSHTMKETLADKEKLVEVVGASLGVSPDPKGSYRTAFFEACPKNPDTFIRGEGKTVEEAEAHAFKQFEKFSACKQHEFTRRNYTNGVGFCKHCGLFKSHAFEPIKTDPSIPS